MAMHAQTNLQLFNQLAAGGYSEAEIGTARDAYMAAIGLFSGLYRSSGKTFVAHAIGTASVLAARRAPIDMVAAAILHSAYTLGEFGSLRRKIDARKRDRIRSAIGANAERLVYLYATTPWTQRAVRTLLAGVSLPAGIERDVLVMRLANEVDDFADFGALYSASWQLRCDAATSFLPPCTELAERLGEDELAATIRRLADETLACARPLTMTIPSPGSMLVPPASHAPRARLRIRDIAGTIRTALRGTFTGRSPASTHAD